jgi:hypothetical protein
MTNYKPDKYALIEARARAAL